MLYKYTFVCSNKCTVVSPSKLKYTTIRFNCRRHSKKRNLLVYFNKYTSLLTQVFPLNTFREFFFKSCTFSQMNETVQIHWHVSRQNQITVGVYFLEQNQRNQIYNNIANSLRFQFSIYHHEKILVPTIHNMKKMHSKWNFPELRLLSWFPFSV